MTLVLRHNERHELNRIEYRGRVTTAELTALADYQFVNPTWLAYDCINVVSADADFDSVSFTDLDAIFAKYRALFEPRRLAIFRRSAWICESPQALTHVSHWIGGRNLRQGMSSDVRLLDDYAAACAWLVLAPTMAEVLATGEGFSEVARYDMPVAGFSR